MTELDYRYVLEYTARTSRQEGKDEGKAEGIAQGLAQGKAEGIAEGASAKSIEIAKALLSNGVDISIISNSTGLSVEQIKSL